MTDDKDIVEAEADGDDTIDFEYAGVTYTVPANTSDLDGDYMYGIEEQKWTVAVRGMLGPEQAAAFRRTHPKVSDYFGVLTAYHDRLKVGAGGIAGLLRLLRDHPDAVEADLSRFHNRRLHDRYHPDPKQRLTLRQIAVLVRWLPPESACESVNQSGAYWTAELDILDDMRRWVAALAGADIDPHPRSPMAIEVRETTVSKRDADLAEVKRLRAAEQAQLEGRADD